MAATPLHGALSCTLLLVVANLLIPISILVFATGFFPYKPFLPGLAHYEELKELNDASPPRAPFDRLVFMVVDALRSDFVYATGSGFHFTQSLIRDGAAMPYTANARSPTVTMPRIKAMTTGSIPSFVDLILNFDESDTSSTLAAQDTWLAQLKATKRGKLLMYGDDTWLKLFPDTFDRHDGTSSFFVSDFTEVDNNVTRNIARELDRSDWSLMVLHYLGLDHIGHKAGPKSPNMLLKQLEMDGIVKVIYDAVTTKSHLRSTLLVLCGDHGMNDAGNHGASSPGETSPALVFISPKLKAISSPLPAPAQFRTDFDYYTTVEQSDIVPTVAALLGFPVSKNNLGTIITDFLALWSTPADKVQLLMRNARQLLGIVSAAFGRDLFESDGQLDPCLSEATKLDRLACDWRKIDKRSRSVASATQLDRDWLSAVSAWMREAQDLVSGMASNYNVIRLSIGQCLAFAAAFASACTVSRRSSDKPGLPMPLLLLSTAYGNMMFASSYVEEEHHFWYWSSSFWIAWLGSQAVRRSRRLSTSLRFLLALTSLRLIRSWNQTGQKFAGAPDVVKSFINPHPQLLWALVGAMYLLVSVQIFLSLDGLPHIVAAAIASVLFSSALAFKLAFTAEAAPEIVTEAIWKLQTFIQDQSLLSRARLVFSLLALLAVYAVVRARKGGRHARRSVRLLHHICTMLAMTQTRATNIPLFILLTVLLQAAGSVELTEVEMTTLSILFQYASFFAFGGSNAISSIDLSSAYNGIDGFRLVPVAVLTFVGNWAGSLFWTSASVLLLLEKHAQGRPEVLRRHLSLQTVFTTTSVAFVMAACTALRTHLFIWTVFSPKYLYCMAWSLGQHLVMNIGLGSLLFLLGAQ